MAPLRSSAVVVVATILQMLVGLAWGKFEVEKNSIKILFPEDMKGNYDSAIGNFGISQYGGTMVGSVVYPVEGAMACTPFDGKQDWRNHSMGARPIILLVDRGSCFFAEKVFHAQEAGAKAVLVADNRDEDLIPMDSPESGRDSPGYVENITIPSALIKLDLGTLMKEYLISGKGDLTIQLDWKESLPHPDERVEYELPEDLTIQLDWRESLPHPDERVEYELPEDLTIQLDWRESLPHPDERVEYEFWTNSNEECGPKCDAQVDFVKNFKGAAQILGIEKEE